MESNSKQTAAARFDAASAIYGPSDMDNVMAFSLGGNVKHPLDRGREWGETETGWKEWQRVLDAIAEEKLNDEILTKAIHRGDVRLLTDADKALLVAHRAACLAASGFDFENQEHAIGDVGFNGLNCVQTVRMLKNM